MATIPTPGSEVRHVRKTITFDGSANNGNLGDDVTVFTITGRVILERFTAYVTDSLVCAAGATTDIAFYPRSQSRLGSPASANQWSAGYWYQTEGQVDSPGTTLPAYFGGSDHAPFAMADDLTLRVQNSGGGADVTAGTVIVDVWYRPITDDGALAGDDIDSQLVDAIWDEAQSGHTTAGTFGRYLDSQLATIASYIDTEVAAIKAKTDSLTFSVAGMVDANVTDWKGATAPAMTGDAYARLGAPAGASVSADVAAVQADTDNIQTRIPAALVGGRMDSSVGAMAAAVITAAAIATDAIDADALAADAVTEIWPQAMSELSAAPAVTGTVLQALEWIFLLARNKMTQTASTQTLLKDDGSTTLSTSAVSDNGTTFTRGEWA